MIIEDYVSFETAKLLKKNGFDARCPMIYTADGKLLYADAKHHNMHAVTNKYLEYYTDIIAPSQTMAMKWLREVHHYYIQVMLDSWACGGHMGYYVVIQKTDSDFEMVLQDAIDEVFYQTYEEACETAIKYCLENLI